MMEQLSPDFSEDRLLDGRVMLKQPVEGFRTAIDPVLLAAAIAAAEGDAVLELGSGTGAASLCLAARLPSVSITGIELQPDLVEIARANATANNAGSRVSFLCGDIAAPLAEILGLNLGQNLGGAPAGGKAAGFDHIMANPPYLPRGSATLPKNAGKAIAVAEGSASLDTWIAFALAAVKPRGSLTFIHRADRLGDLLQLLDKRAGDIAVFPLWPKRGKPAKRVLLSARKGVATPMRLLAGLVLHEEDGRFTADAEAVLRKMAPLHLEP